MAQAHKGGKLNHKINCFCFGDYFVGKTTFGLQLAKLHDENCKPMRLLVIDAEQGGNSFALDELEESGVNMDNVYTVWTQSLAETTHYIDLIKRGEPLHELSPDGEELDEYVLDADKNPFVPTALFIDGITILKMTCQQSLLNLSRKRAKVRAKNNGLTGEEKVVAIEGAGLEFKDYNTLNFSGQELILDLMSTNIHWVASAREKKETKSVKVNGSIQSIETGKIIADGFKGAEFNSSTLVRLYRDEDDPDTVKMQVLKDRSRTWAVGQIIENPSLLDMQAMIDKDAGENIVVKNTMAEAIETESRIYQQKAGIITDDEPQESSTSSEYTPDPAELKAQIKNVISKLYPDKKKEAGNRIKAADLPTAYTKIDDVGVLNQILNIVKEVAEE